MKNSMAIAYSMKKKGKPSSHEDRERQKGQKGVHIQAHNEELGSSKAGDYAYAGYTDEAKDMHESKLEQLKAMPKPNLPMSEGGDVDENDLVDRIMKKRMYSEGGMVANEDGPIADDMDAEYDDLVLDDHLESHYDGKDSGDELGNKELDHEDHDLVERIMKSRAKKDKLPRPL